MAIAFTTWLPNHWYRVHAPTARLAFAFETVFGAKHGSFLEWLEPWMRPDTGDTRLANAVFTRDVITDVDLAFDLGHLSQAALIALGPRRLRQAGAFAKDRVTDTSITIGG